jgi:translation initiation factor IF-3
MLHRDHGYSVLEQITESMDDLARIERTPRMAGRRLTVLFVPKKSPSPDKDSQKES